MRIRDADEDTRVIHVAIAPVQSRIKQYAPNYLIKCDYLVTYKDNQGGYVNVSTQIMFALSKLQNKSCQKTRTLAGRQPSLNSRQG